LPVAQDDLEPVIRRFAEAAGPGELRFNTELTSFSQQAGGVTGTMTSRLTGEAMTLSARYLIAADGAQSRVRRALGVQMTGEEKVFTEGSGLAIDGPWGYLERCFG
jgi:putative polyketide hydroxylase